jgi:ABC-2 type transport system permease protein
MFFSGLAVPLVLFPEPFRSLVLALPWAAYMQVPIDIWLGQRHGTGVLTGLAFQAGWGAALLLACAALLRFADRKVVVHGG